MRVLVRNIVGNYQEDGSKGVMVIASRFLLLIRRVGHLRGDFGTVECGNFRDTDVSQE